MRGAQLCALAVEERLPKFAATIDEVIEEREFEDRYYAERMTTARDRARQVGVELRTESRPGHPARTIVDFARDGEFDLIVVGHSGHSKVWAMFLGTTA